MWKGFEKIFGKTGMKAHAGNLPFWHEKLCEKGIAPEELATGCRKILELGHTFPPSLGEFINYCRPPPPAGALNRETFPEETQDDTQAYADEKEKYRDKENPAGKMARELRKESTAEAEERKARESVSVRLDEEEHERLMKDEGIQGQIYRKEIIWGPLEQ
jgi:hypothetical protein